MDILLDTHILLWLFNDDPRLSKKLRQIMSDPKLTFYYSIVSMWEVAIKHSKHPDKMNTSGTLFMHYCEQSGFKKLPLDERHVLSLETLELDKEVSDHSDPFDRILLSQAKADGMTFITHDNKFSAYHEPNVFVV